MVDYLCIAPHPDDAELVCGGLLLKVRRAGLSVVIVDCTRGEMATRGSVAIRRRETAAANRILRPESRVNLALPDGRLCDDDSLREPLVHALRRFRPRIVLAPHWEDQHPDHAAVGQAAIHAAWNCGVPRYAPRSAKGVASPDRLPYRPQLLLHYNNRYGIVPELVADISEVFEEKLLLAGCYVSQVGGNLGPACKGAKPSKREPLTRLSSARFQQVFRALHIYYGSRIGAEYGEAYCLKGPVPLWAPAALLRPGPTP
jgi:bacillithiol biosynthesis deacetylase BshB1